MRNITRKYTHPLLHIACAIGMVAVFSLPTSLAYAEADLVENKESDTLPLAPTGEVWQILKGNAIIYLTLPELPLAWFEYIIPDESGENLENNQPPLRSLLIERADPKTPDTWAFAEEILWNNEYCSYCSANERSLLINYADEYGLVSYTEMQTKYRNFYARITATVLLDGVIETIVYEPMYIEFSDEMKPPGFEEEEESDNGNGGNNENDDDNSDWNWGSIDGNRGGVGQGESSRIDPEGSVRDLLQKPQSAYAAPQYSDSATDPAPEKDSVPSVEEESDTTQGAPSRTKASSTDSSAEQSPDGTQEHIPGFIWAIGASGIAVAAGATIVALRRRAG